MDHPDELKTSIPRVTQNLPKDSYPEPIILLGHTIPDTKTDSDTLGSPVRHSAMGLSSMTYDSGIIPCTSVNLTTLSGKTNPLLNVGLSTKVTVVV